MMCLPRYHTHDDGVRREYFFDDLANGYGFPEEPLLFEYPWAGYSYPSQTDNGTYSLSPTLATTDIVTKVKYRSRYVRSSAKTMATLLQESGLPYNNTDLEHRVRIAIAVFEGRRIAFRRLFRSLKPCAVVLTHSPSHYGEIAAARELNIPVIELQNGIIGRNDPEYQWPEQYSPFKAEMPNPNIIALHGSLYENFLLSNGFWASNELAVVGCGALDRYREKKRTRKFIQGQPLKLLFMSQTNTQGMSIPFFKEFLEACAQDSLLQVQLDIKIHPLEKSGRESYDQLAIDFPEHCRIISKDAYPLDVICNTDAVLSYSSLSIAEAVALGVPTISLSGEMIPEGFAELFQFLGMEEVVPNVSTPTELADTLKYIFRDTEAITDLNIRLQNYGKILFKKDFLNVASKVIHQKSNMPYRD